MLIEKLRSWALAVVRPQNEAASVTNSDAAETARSYLLGIGKDHHGRHVQEVLAFDDGAWENTHDFVQWLFPSTQPSQFHDVAPVLTLEQLASLGLDPEVRAVLAKAYARALRGLGLRVGADGQLEELPVDLPVFRPAWLRRPDHSDFRISRMLHCLAHTGLTQEVEALMDFLERNFEADPKKAESLTYWRAAAAKNLP